MSGDLEAYVREAARALDIELAEERIPDVAATLAGVIEMSKAFEDVELGPEDEPAPVFTP